MLARLLLRSSQALSTTGGTSLRAVCSTLQAGVVPPTSNTTATTGGSSLLHLHTSSASFGKHAKNKSGSKGGKEKAAAAPAEPVDTDFSAEEVLEKCDGSMTKAVDYLQNELDGVRSGRAHPGLIQHIQVDAHGEHVPLKAVGAVIVRNNQTLAVTVYDPTLVDAVVKAIETSPLELRARIEGGDVIVPIPRLSGDSLNKMARLVKQEVEEAKVSLRHARHAALDTFKKAPLSTDERKAQEQQVQKLYDSYVKKVEQLGSAKDKELHAH